MNDEQMQHRLDTWYRDRDVPRPEVRTGVVRVMAELPQTRQHRRWWPFPDFHRKAVMPTAAQATADELSLSQATNGYTPTVIGRTKSMLSPAKAITAGALVFAIGGAFLITQPLDQPADGQLGAAGDEAVPQAPTEFQGTLHCRGQVGYGSSENIEVAEGVVRSESRGNAWRPGTMEMSDPRLEGRYTLSLEDDSYFFEGMPGITPPSLGAGTWRIENDDGVWQGSYYGIGYTDGTGATGTTPLVGEGAYEGYVAIMEAAYDAALTGSTCGWVVRGIIVESELPRIPEAFVLE